MMLRSSQIIRRFSKPPTQAEFRRMGLKYNLIYFSIIGACIGAYKLYTYKLDPPKDRNQRTSAIKNTMTKRPEYQGIKREDELASLFNLIQSEHITIVFGLPKSGTSNFLSMVQSSAPIEKPVLFLQIKDSIEDTVNQFQFDRRLGSSQFNTFLSNVNKALDNTSGLKPLVIIDGIEKIDPMSRNNLNTQILRWQRLNKADILLGTSQLSNIDFFQASNN